MWGGALAPRPLAAPRGKRGLLRPIPRQLPLCGVSLVTYPATLLLLRAGLYLAGGGQPQSALLRGDCGCRRRGFASPQSSPREE